MSRPKCKCVVCQRDVPILKPRPGALRTLSFHCHDGKWCPGSLMEIIPPDTLPANPVIQEPPLPLLIVGIYTGAMLMGVERFADPRALFCKMFNDRSLHHGLTEMTALPLVAEGTVSQ